MARSKTTTTTKTEIEVGIKLPKINIERGRIWLIGDTPLICHAWSEKARRSMLEKQQKETKEGSDKRNPEEDFQNSLYDFGEGKYGFPAMAAKKAFLSVAHKDKGVPRASVQQALFLTAPMVRTRPARGGAVCDMPLLRIWGSKPEMREDMVRVGVGMSKTATLAYRAQFRIWALRIVYDLNVSQCPIEWIPFLAHHSGTAIGLGDWRNEKGGMFGRYHVGVEAEVKAWEDFRAGKGPLPEPKVDEDVEDFDFDEAAQ